MKTQILQIMFFFKKKMISKYPQRWLFIKLGCARRVAPCPNLCNSPNLISQNCVIENHLARRYEILLPYPWGYISSNYPGRMSDGRRVTIRNNHGENLVGILHNSASVRLVIVCHGFQSSKVVVLHILRGNKIPIFFLTELVNL